MGTTVEFCDKRRRSLLGIALASAAGVAGCATDGVAPNREQSLASGSGDPVPPTSPSTTATLIPPPDRAALEKVAAEKALIAKQAQERAAKLQLEADLAEERHRLAMAELERATARAEAIRNSIVIEAREVKTGSFDDLVRVIRTKGGAKLNTVSLQTIVDDLAWTFVDNAWTAVDKGYPIPKWIVKKLPPRRAAFPVLGLMFFTIGGVGFAIPVATFLAATLAALAVSGSVLTLAVGALLDAKTQSKS